MIPCSENIGLDQQDWSQENHGVINGFAQMDAELEEGTAEEKSKIYITPWLKITD